MQKLIIICFAILATGCSSRSTAPMQVEVGFGGTYQHDGIALFVDGSQVYSNTLTTPEGETGLTDSTSFESAKEKLQFRIVVSNRESTGEVDLRNGRFLCIMHADGRPYLHQSQEPYMTGSGNMHNNHKDDTPK